MDTVILIKLISNLLYPLGLSCSLLVLGLLARWRQRRRIAGCSIVLSVLVLLLSSNPMVARWLAGKLESQYPQQPLQLIANHDAILVLGGGIRIPTAPAMHPQLGVSSDRLWYAAQLYRAGKAPRVFLLGGNVYPQPGLQPEAFYARDLLVQWGVPVDAIVLETQSRTTEQNRDGLRPLIQQYELKSALLVTSALHMPRAKVLFDDLPLRLTPASADVLVREVAYPTLFEWLPSASALLLSTKALHEYYGGWFARIN
ncbi:hypothetical protein GCM10008090_10650 [Arenicella chitinivorans]|uniref:DUF218 domain-containing protein n=1 Tax=Arenicella chitinivorans TaxID=1329800 RepID=A0A918RPG2_9GAMM|nr:YdcF family protein [Arenicella chitinivorans]GHA03438.1 hypothetical protein GCM10008090_10650 [Arenicella chitinivorans]